MLCISCETDHEYCRRVCIEYGGAATEEAAQLIIKGEAIEKHYMHTSKVVMNTSPCSASLKMEKTGFQQSCVTLVADSGS